MNIFGDEGLKEKIGVFKKENARLQDVVAGNQLAVDIIHNNHRIEIAQLQEVIRLSNDLFDLRLRKESSSELKNLENQEKNQDKTHTDRMKKLEAEHTAKIVKFDRDLEVDKISYRKYIKQEFNNRVEHLEKEVSRLSAKNNELMAVDSAREFYSGVMEGSVESLSETIKQLIVALPVVSATITTPEVSVANAGNNGNLKS